MNTYGFPPVISLHGKKMRLVSVAPVPYQVDANTVIRETPLLHDNSPDFEMMGLYRAEGENGEIEVLTINDAEKLAVS